MKENDIKSYIPYRELLSVAAKEEGSIRKNEKKKKDEKEIEKVKEMSGFRPISPENL